mmetsp:Transcript_74039/g.176261  ORF Transcript_74039/g.176261 Transcript_74039/m.176261 type:complete len:1260 (-) Transcript_74039:73-3852(-)
MAAVPAAVEYGTGSLVPLLGQFHMDPKGEEAATAWQSKKELAPAVKKKLKKVFKSIDLDGNGTVSGVEFRKLLTTCDTAMLGISNEDLSEMFDEVDADHNNEIDYEEFVAWLGMQESKSKRPQWNPEIEAFKPSQEHCWRELGKMMLQSFAQGIGVFKPTQGMVAEKADRQEKLDRLRLEVGGIYETLTQRRVRAQNATRRWIAESHAQPKKVYQKKVEEVEKKDVKARQEREAMEEAMANDPEAREAAQLGGWAAAQGAEKLSSFLEQQNKKLKQGEEDADRLDLPVIHDVASKVTKELYPKEKSGLPSNSAQPFEQAHLVEGQNCLIRTTMDAVYVENEGLIACADLNAEEQPVEKKGISKQNDEQTPKDLGIDVLVMMDMSDSMAEELQVVVRTLVDLAENLHKQDQLSIITFNSKADLVLNWTEMSQEGRTEAKNTVKGLQAGGALRYLPAGELMINQLKALPGSASDYRQALVVFVSDGLPAERGGVLSFFAQRLIAFPDAMFSPICMGPESDAVVMSEIARACRCPFSYITELSALSAELGKLTAMARTTVLSNAYMVVRPLRGLTVNDPENLGEFVPWLEPTWDIEEVSVSSNDIERTFRCIITFPSEAEAVAACQFTGGERDPVILKNDVLDPTPPNGAPPKVVAKAGQRLLQIKRSNFLAKSKKLQSSTFADFVILGEELAGPGGFEQRLPKHILITGISKGPVELEFEPLCWSGTNVLRSHRGWEITSDCTSDRIILGPGTRLVGYRKPGKDEVEREDLQVPSDLDQSDKVACLFWMLDTLGKLGTYAGLQDLTLIFEVPQRPCLIPVGSLRRGENRQVLFNLGIPPALRPENREQFQVDAAQPLMEAFLIGRAVSSGTAPVQVRQRIGLTVAQVPSLMPRNKASHASEPRGPYRIRFATKTEQEKIDVDKFVGLIKDALAEARPEAVAEVTMEVVSEGSGGITLDIMVAAGPCLPHQVISACCSKLARSYLAEEGYELHASPPVVRGCAAIRRLLQLRFAQGLNMVANKDCSSWDGIERVQELCASKTLQLLAEVDPYGNLVRTVTMDAIAVRANTHEFEKTKDFTHRLVALVSALVGNFSPSTALDGLHLYETKDMWALLSTPKFVRERQEDFAERAAVREQAPRGVTEVTFAGAEKDSLSIKFQAAGHYGKAVTAYTLQVKDVESGEKHSRSIRANTENFQEGRWYHVSIDGLQPGRSFAAVLFAYNGRQGPVSVPVWCSTPISAHAESHARCPPGRRATVLLESS